MKQLFSKILVFCIIIGSFALPANAEFSTTLQYPIINQRITELTVSATLVPSQVNIKYTSTGATRTLTLYSTTERNTCGRVVHVQAPSDAATYNMTIDPAGSELIGGASTKVISKNSGTVEFRNNCTAGAWDILEDNSTPVATDSLAAHLAGSETLTGAKTFTAAVYKRGFETQAQATPTAETAAATLTIAKMLTKIITISHSTGATAALTTDTGAAIEAGVTMAAGDSFDFTVINLSAAALDTVTLTAGASGVTLVGRVITPSAHATTVADSSTTYRVLKTSTNNYTIYAL